MKKKLYVAPQCEVMELELQGMIAASGDFESLELTINEGGTDNEKEQAFYDGWRAVRSPGLRLMQQ